MGNNVYTYGEKDLYEEDHYQKYIVVKFINNMGHLREATSITEADKKRLKRLIDILFFLRTCNLEERKTIFGSCNFISFEFYGILTMVSHDVCTLFFIA